MARRALVLGVALAVTLVATPRPVPRGGKGLAPLARVLAVWSAGPLRLESGVDEPYAVLPDPRAPRSDLPRPGDPHIESVPGGCLAPEDGAAAVHDRARPRVDVAAGPSADAARAVAQLLAVVERRAADTGELWLVALVERGGGVAGEDVVRLGVHGPISGPSAGQGGGQRAVALDLRWLPDGLTSADLEAWFAAHLAGPPDGARGRWPRWLQRRPELGVELVANGDASSAWPSGATPPGWSARGRVVRALQPDGQAWFEAPDGWCALTQRCVLPVATAPDGSAPDGPALEVSLAARFAPETSGTVQVLWEADVGSGEGGTGLPAPPLALSATGERRARLPPGARAASVEVRLTGSASGVPRVTDVSIRVVRAEE